MLAKWYALWFSKNRYLKNQIFMANTSFRIIFRNPKNCHTCKYVCTSSIWICLCVYYVWILANARARVARKKSHLFSNEWLRRKQHLGCFLFCGFALFPFFFFFFIFWGRGLHPNTKGNLNLWHFMPAGLLANMRLVVPYIVNINIKYSNILHASLEE